MIPLSATAKGDKQSLELFHGTDSDFDAFRPSPDGIFFTSRLETATAYALGHDDRPGAQVLCVQLNLEQPLFIDEAFLAEFEKANRIAVERARALHYPFGSLSFVECFGESDTWARDLVFAEARRLGAECLIIDRDASPDFHMAGDWSARCSYVVFDPARITILEAWPVESLTEDTDPAGGESLFPAHARMRI